jgi:hypothetical protein
MTHKSKSESPGKKAARQRHINKLRRAGSLRPLRAHVGRAAKKLGGVITWDGK